MVISNDINKDMRDRGTESIDAFYSGWLFTYHHHHHRLKTSDIALHHDLYDRSWQGLSNKNISFITCITLLSHFSSHHLLYWP